VQEVLGAQADQLVQEDQADQADQAGVDGAAQAAGVSWFINLSGVSS